MWNAHILGICPTGWSYGNTAITRFGTQFILAVRKSAWAAIDRSELPVVYPKTHMNSKKGERTFCSCNVFSDDRNKAICMGAAG
jgi:hypothetical protein